MNKINYSMSPETEKAVAEINNMNKNTQVEEIMEKLKERGHFKTPKEVEEYFKKSLIKVVQQTEEKVIEKIYKETQTDRNIAVVVIDGDTQRPLTLEDLKNLTNKNHD